MKTLNRFLIRLRNLITGRRGDQRLREELEDYVSREAQANMQAGMSEREARRQARIKLGAAEAIREQYHAEEGLLFLECLAQDTRISLRQMGTPHASRKHFGHGNGAAMQSVENDGAVSHTSHICLEDADEARVSHIPTTTATR